MRIQGFAFAFSLILNGSLTACHTIGDNGSATLNCNFETPPENSGEMSSHGGQMRIYPRSIEMSKHYSGCQTAWDVSNPKKASILVQTHYINGMVTELRAVDRDPGGKICRYNKRALVDGPQTCPTFETANKREASLPPGCLNTVAHSAETEDVPCLHEYK